MAYFNSGFKVTRQVLIANTPVQVFSTPLAARLALCITNDDPALPNLAIGDANTVTVAAGANQGKPISPGAEWWEPVGPAITAIWLVADVGCTITIEEFA